MKILAVFIAALSLPATLSAQEQLREVIVSAARPIANTGLHTSPIDSAALKENIAMSMADVLGYNSSIFVKSYGRATLSTVSFRGTSASHTQVTWNGMPITNPMQGMTDFSTIPSYFIDRATVVHGNSSLGEGEGGGLGGLVSLASVPVEPHGFKIQYVQGIGSFGTFDEFARISYGAERWRSSTRVVYSSSRNDYTYINRDKKENIYDDAHNIIGQYHPRERNRSGEFKDLHVLQDVYYRDATNSAGISAWFIDSNRELPLLTTDYAYDTQFDNRQRERTLRTVASWQHFAPKWQTTLRGGYIHTWLAYDYSREVGSGQMAVMSRARSRINSFFFRADASFAPAKAWFFETSLSGRQHLVRSADKNVMLVDNDRTILGYDVERSEASATVSAKWRPVQRVGLSVLLREELNATEWSPLMPAVYADALLWPAANLTLRASAARNYRYPSLNDLYFLPGGNTQLRPERSYSYDAGLSTAVGREGKWRVCASAGWFDSQVDDWIMWLPTPKGFFSPHNVMRVHAYGIESDASAQWCFAPGWRLDATASFSWTPSVNQGPAQSDADRSVGQQLPYVPRRSAAATARLSWRGWSLFYKWCHYSERFTMSSNDHTLTGRLPAYYMNNIEIEKVLSWRPLDLSVKLLVNNLFNEEYLSVLSRPMPGINFEFFVSITPRI